MADHPIHPWFGPCDQLGRAGVCSECINVVQACQSQMTRMVVQTEAAERHSQAAVNHAQHAFMQRARWAGRAMTWKRVAKIYRAASKEWQQHYQTFVEDIVAFADIARAVRSGSRNNPGEPTYFALEWKGGRFRAILWWDHHDGPIDEHEGVGITAWEATENLVSKIREERKSGT